MAPNIVFIDDYIEELNPLSELVKSKGASFCEVFSPKDINTNILITTNLVIVDITLDEWIDNEQVDQISLRPINGVALAAVLRQHSELLGEFPPTGFALITGQDIRLGPLPDEQRPHVISRLNNVEWFFEKDAENPELAIEKAQKIVSLASAIEELPDSLGKVLGNIDGLISYLGVPNESVAERVRDSVRRCRPPIHHLGKQSHGLMILRWLLHRILPHTSFLIDKFSLAARLGVEFSWLESNLSEKSSLHALFAGCIYTGPLQSFDGLRWWRSSVEQILWDITNSNSSKTAEIHAALESNGAPHPEGLGMSRPVITLNHNLKIEESFSERDDTVLIQLDDWPSYAEPAYMRRDELAAHEEMRIYVTEDE